MLCGWGGEIYIYKIETIIVTAVSVIKQQSAVKHNYMYIFNQLFIYAFWLYCKLNHGAEYLIL